MENTPSGFFFVFNQKKHLKNFAENKKLSTFAPSKKIKCFGDLVQTYGVMVAQQILVLLVEVRIPIGLQASESFSQRLSFSPYIIDAERLDVRGYRYAVFQTEILAMDKTNNSFYSLLKK